MHSSALAVTKTGLKSTRPHDADKIRLSDIRVNEASIVEMDRHKYGAYRDEDQSLHVVSATCTHLCCTVRCNSDEMSWDCPCHGSRFAYNGRVLNGPARADLLYYKEPAGRNRTLSEKKP